MKCWRSVRGRAALVIAVVILTMGAGQTSKHQESARIQTSTPSVAQDAARSRGYIQALKELLKESECRDASIGQKQRLEDDLSEKTSSAQDEEALKKLAERTEQLLRDCSEQDAAVRNKVAEDKQESTARRDHGATLPGSFSSGIVGISFVLAAVSLAISILTFWKTRSATRKALRDAGLL